MSKQSSNMNHSSTGKRLRPKNRLQVILLVAVSIWLTYQLGQAYSKRRPVALAVEVNGDNGVDGELIRRRWLGRKGIVEIAGNASQKDAPGISGRGTVSGSDDAGRWESMPAKGARGPRDEDDNGFSGFDDGDDSNFRGAQSNELDVRPAKASGGLQGGAASAAVEMVTGAAKGNGMNLGSNSSHVNTGLTRNSSSVVSFFFSKRPLRIS